jgi:hypothetical protein
MMVFKITKGGEIIMKRIANKLSCVLFAAFLCFIAMKTHPAQAFDLDLYGKPISMTGYIKQNVGYNVYGGNNWDTKRDVENAFFEFLTEAAYNPTSTLKLFVSGRINTDWTYLLYNNNDEWREKEFDDSESALYFFGDGEDILHEANISWAPGNFFFRLGKQVVKWGQTDGFRLMDQINPVDQRRGMLDIEFESTILPIWLFRGEYKVPVTFMESLNLQLVFNPNIHHRPNEGIKLGTQEGGVWTPRVDVPLGGPYPFDYARIGSYNWNIDDPDGSDGFEYAFKMQASFWDSIASLNYYYGRDKDPIYLYDGNDTFTISPWDQRMVIHPGVTGYYARTRFVGGTFSRDIPRLSSSALGGVAPTFRVEAFYAFDNTFRLDHGNQLHESDELRVAIGADWKVKINLLNPKAYFMISPQWYFRKIMDFPSNDHLWSASEDYLYGNNQITTLLINTTYFHTKLTPSIFWMRNWTQKNHMWKYELSYSPTYKWKYALGALYVGGDSDADDKGLTTFDRKDQVYVTVRYNF